MAERRAYVGYAVHHAQDDFEVAALLVAQHDRHVGGVEDAKHLGMNRAQQRRAIELAGDGARQLQEHGQLVDLAAVLLVELRVLEGEGGLVRERLEQHRLRFREDPARDIAQRQGADHPPLRPQRHGEHRSGSGVPHRRALSSARAAWSANASARRISSSSNCRPTRSPTPRAPMTRSPTRSGTARTERLPMRSMFARIATVKTKCGSLSKSGVATGARSRTATPTTAWPRGNTVSRSIATPTSPLTAKDTSASDSGSIR